MKLPTQLQLGIEELTSQVDRKELAHASEELSNCYRAPGGRAVLPTPASNDITRAAYLATRVPATYAAIYAVLRELKQRLPGMEPRSLLDLGAGPGTAMWAAAEVFDQLEQLTLIERTSAFIRLGEMLAASAGSPAIQNARWVEGDLMHEARFPGHDLVIVSYALGEVAPENRRQLLGRAWQATGQAIAIIEPGTPRGFEVVLHAREELLQPGAHLVAPCPHEKQCPMTPGSAQNVPPDAPRRSAQNRETEQDWCHFAQRLERTSLHRRLKSGELGYEDEKFSYVVAARSNVDRAAARVIRHPVQLKGHINLELCTPTGLAHETVGRKQGERFKRARKTRWGEEWK